MNTRWVKSLLFAEEEDIEPRIATILKYLANKPDKKWVVREIEAIGRCGSAYTKRINEEKEILLDTTHLIELFSEEGQVIEFDGFLLDNNHAWIRVIIYDGCDVQIFSQDIELPDSIIGKYSEETVGEFFGI